MDRRQIIRSYFTDRHLDNEKLRVLFIEPIIEEFGLMSDYAELIQLFGSVDDIPESFLEDLGDSLAYEYLQEENADVQREIIKRILRVYKNRSSRAAIEDTLRYSTDRNWIGDKLTLYKGDLKEGYQNIWLPRDRIFYHDKSIHDGGDRFMDRLTYNYGVINLEMQFFDDRTLEMLEQQIPGGIRWNIDHLIWFPGTGGNTTIPKYTTEFAGVGYLEDLTLMPTDLYIPEDIAYFDSILKRERDISKLRYNGGLLGDSVESIINAGKLGQPYSRIIDGGYTAIASSPVRSGQHVVMLENAEELVFEASYLDGWNIFNAGKLGQPYRLILNGGRLGEKRGAIFNAGVLGSSRESVYSPIIRPTFYFDIEEGILGVRHYDINDHDDGTSRDGLDTGEVTLYARYRETSPNDVLYSVSSVFDSTILDNADSLSRGFDVEEFG